MNEEERLALKEKRESFVAEYSTKDKVCFNCSFARRSSRSHGEFGDFKFICGEPSRGSRIKGQPIGHTVYAWGSCGSFKPNCYCEV